MKNSKTNNWEELLFEHRSRDYGAYSLRRNYPRCLTLSAAAVILVFMLCVGIINYSGEDKDHTHIIREIKIINYNELTEPPSIEKAYTPPKKVAKKQPVIEKHVEPEVVKEEIIEPEIEEIVDEIKEVVNPVETEEDSDDWETLEGAESDAPADSFYNIGPSFPGGGNAFGSWLAQNLRYPEAAKRMGIEGKVVVGFKIDENGRIYNVKIIKSLHRLCDMEAIRLVKIMPLWVPGIKEGMKIQGRLSVEIPFELKFKK